MSRCELVLPEGLCAADVTPYGFAEIWFSTSMFLFYSRAQLIQYESQFDAVVKRANNKKGTFGLSKTFNSQLRRWISLFRF